MPLRLTSVIVVFLAAALAGAACEKAPAPVVVAPAMIHTLGIDARSNEHVSLASAGAMVVAMWASSDATDRTDVYAAVSRDAGATFAAPARVNAEPGDARVNGEAPPQAAVVRRPTGGVEIVAVWTGRRAAEDLLLTARSTDEGRSFGATTVVAGTAAPGLRGWHTVGVTAAGAIDALWLDHRRAATPSAPAAAAHQHHGAAMPAATTPKTTYDSVAEAQKSDLYFARLDAGSQPRPITAGVCFCCKTAIAHDAGGRTFLAWRHVYPGDMRDIAFASSTDDGRSFSPPVRVSEDHWSIAGCPDDGPSMAVDGAGRVHVVWPTMVTEGTLTVKALFYAATRDGTTFTPRVRVTTGPTPAHHPRIAVDAGGGLVVAWDEGNRVRVARATADGQPTFVVDAPNDSLTGRYPALVAAGASVVMAWVDGVGPGSRVRVERR